MMNNTKYLSKLTDLEKIEICQLFETGNYTFSKLSKLYKVSSSSIAGILKRRGYKALSSSIANRKYSLDENFFEKIDTEDKAYFLGWLYSDGNLSLRPYSGCIVIAINKDDEEILTKLKKCIQYTGPIQYRKRNKAWKGAYENSKDSVVLCITNLKISNDVQKLGMEPAKGETLTFPTEEQVPKHLIHHFIRGYFDGDGSFYEKKKNGNYWMFRFDGTKEFLEGLVEYFKTLNPEISINIQKRHKDRVSNSYNLELNCNRNLESVNKMYENATIFLERKHDKYLKIVPRRKNVKKESELRELP